jgi:peptide/nickel transport system permease protein
MIKFLVRRLIFLLVSVFVASVAVFAISEVAPGNIARNTLGNTITPAQEQSFDAQNGLDQPVVTRYLRWMIGSDWQAASLIGHPVVRLYDAANQRNSWWGQAADDTYFHNATQDGEVMQQLNRQPDGTTKAVDLGPEVWKTNAQGVPIFWGVDQEGHAAMWVKGKNLTAWVLTHASWTSTAGAPQQYIPLERGLLRGDPGVSFLTGRPVMETLTRRLINTGILAGIAFVFVMPLALLLGLVAGLNEGKFIDRLLSTSSLVATAMPEFASGIFLILIFSTWLHLFPGAVVVSNDAAIFENPTMLILPVLTLTLVELGYILRITRASMVEVMRTNYIRTAVLKGLPRWRIVFQHALRNALMAPITVIILHVNWLIGGIVVVEALFGYPGLGRYILDAALFKDIFGIEAAAMVLIVVAVGTQLVADLIYTYLNPRIRFA